jgi:DNA-directed RNA polymerase subunit beta'
MLPGQGGYIKSKVLGGTRPAEKSTFDYLQIGIASPARIRGWATRVLPDGSTYIGHILNGETLHYKNSKPYPGGLFCEQTFGPVKDWSCRCERHKGQAKQGTVCEKCQVEVTSSKVRKYRMGCVELPTPVVHIWYLKAKPSKIGLLLNLHIKIIDRIVYNELFIVTDPSGNGELDYRSTLTFMQWQDFVAKYPKSKVKISTGAVAIKKLLEDLDLEKEANDLRHLLPTARPNERLDLIKKLRLINKFISTNSSPTWMVLDVLPILPPDLRPLVKLEEGFFVSSDLNELYKRILYRCQRYQSMVEGGMPETILSSDRRLIQEAVDCLMWNGTNGKPYNDGQGRPLKSLSDIIKGKEGRFRRNLLGKRVDYSGRTVIVSGGAGFGSCGLPREMAVVLFEPFIIYAVVCRGLAKTVVGGRKVVKGWYRLPGPKQIIFWELVDKCIRGHPVLLNRAPTLHKFSIQAFFPFLVSGSAICLSPASCSAFHADFDGDQMAVHVPLSLHAQLECRAIVGGAMPTRVEGGLSYSPGQDGILGAFYLTCDFHGRDSVKKKYFHNCKEVIIALEQGGVTIQDSIWLRVPPDGSLSVYTERSTDSHGENKVFIEKKYKDRVYLVSEDTKIKLDSSGTVRETYMLTSVGRVVFNMGGGG